MYPFMGPCMSPYMNIYMAHIWTQKVVCRLDQCDNYCIFLYNFQTSTYKQNIRNICMPHMHIVCVYIFLFAAILIQELLEKRTGNHHYKQCHHGKEKINISTRAKEQMQAFETMQSTGSPVHTGSPVAGTGLPVQRPIRLQVVPTAS